MQNKILEWVLGVKSVLKTELTLNLDQVVQDLLKFQIAPKIKDITKFGDFPRQPIPVFDHFCGLKTKTKKAYL